MITGIVREKDSDLIEKITDVVTSEETVDKKKQLSATLHFAENEYFSNESLSLTLYYKDDDRDEVVRTVGTEILWKDGKDLTKKKIKKK